MRHLCSATLKQGKDERVVWLLRTNVHLAAAALAMAGLILLLASSGSHSLFRQADALLGLSNRTLLVLLGLLHAGLSVWLLAAKDLVSQGLMMLWLGLNCFVYRVGMAWLGAATPLPVVKLVAWKLRASPRAVDICWRLLIGYLVLGSLAQLILQWRRSRRLQAGAFLRRWKELRERGTPPHE
jgi:hypothetical protein